ncbi:MAG: Imm21 family immunity protein [Maioricimonas sp. JB049]
MRSVSSLGGPCVLLPREDVDRWMTELGDAPAKDHGLYGMACTVDGWCGIIRPWETPLLIFGDEPADIYWLPRGEGGLFIRWLAANSLAQLTTFAESVAAAGNWTERLEWDAVTGDYVLMDTCAAPGDPSARIEIPLTPGKYVVESQYAESGEVMTVVTRLQLVR